MLLLQEAPANALLQQQNGFTARADSKADAHEPHAADGPNQPTDNLVSECDYLNAKLKVWLPHCDLIVAPEVA